MIEQEASEKAKGMWIRWVAKQPEQGRNEKRERVPPAAHSNLTIVHRRHLREQNCIQSGTELRARMKNRARILNLVHVLHDFYVIPLVV